MSGAATVPRWPVAERDTGVPLATLIRTELRKLVDTRASMWLLAVVAAASVLVVAGSLAFAAPENLTYDKLVDYTQTPQKLLLPVLGILAVTSEWSQRSGLVTFTLVPRRRRMLLAKAAATVLLGLVVIGLAWAAAAVGNLLGSTFFGGDGGWAFGPGGFRDILVVQTTGLLQGVAVGMLLLNSAAAVAAFFVVPNAWTALFAGVRGLHGARPWVDLNGAQTALYLHEMTAAAWLHVAVAAALWVLAPCVLGALRVSRSEVRSE